MHPTISPLGIHGAGVYAFERDGYARAEPKDLTTADLERATVYGRDDETIGSINSLKLGHDGQITHAVIDVGGFLGIGAHPVLMPFSELTVLRENNGHDVRVHLDTTKERLKEMPYHGA